MELSKPPRINLPTAGPIEMIISEAMHDVQRGYWFAGQPRNKHPKSFEERVQATALIIAKELDLEHYFEET